MKAKAKGYGDEKRGLEGLERRQTKGMGRWQTGAGVSKVQAPWPPPVANPAGGFT